MDWWLVMRSDIIPVHLEKTICVEWSKVISLVWPYYFCEAFPSRFQKSFFFHPFCLHAHHYHFSLQSRPRLPIIVTLFTDAMIFNPFERYYISEIGFTCLISYISTACQLCFCQSFAPVQLLIISKRNLYRNLNPINSFTEPMSILRIIFVNQFSNRIKLWVKTFHHITSNVTQRFRIIIFI